MSLFEGLRVLDVASYVAAPAAATMLSDFGAEVIKIEPPGQGDGYRAMPAYTGGHARLDESRSAL